VTDPSGLQEDPLELREKAPPPTAPPPIAPTPTASPVVETEQAQADKSTDSGVKTAIGATQITQIKAAEGPPAVPPPPIVTSSAASGIAHTVVIDRGTSGPGGSGDRSGSYTFDRLLYDTAEVAAGFGAAFGPLSSLAREVLGINDAIDPNSGLHSAGEVVGTVVGSVLGGLSKSIGVAARTLPKVATQGGLQAVSASVAGALHCSKCSQGLIPAYELITDAIIVPAKGRGITGALWRRIQERAARYGETAPVDVAHIEAHVFTQPGQRVLVRAQAGSVNRAGGAPIRAAAALRRAWNAAHPRGPHLPVR
jgi:hypothetical protein